MIERHNITDRESWLALRKSCVNASEIAVCCGVGPWGSLAELYAEKKGLRPPLVDSGVLRRGRWRELSVFEALAEERPTWDVRRARIYLRDPERRLGCTPDGLAFRPDREGLGVIQAKSVSRTIFRRRWCTDLGDYLTAAPPDYYVLQILTEQILCETQWGVLAVLVDTEFDSELHLFDIERNEVEEDRILFNVNKFWREYFDPGIMPPFNPQRDEALIRAMYPKDSGTMIDLTSDNRALSLVEDLTFIQRETKKLEKSEKQIKTELIGKLGEHTYGMLADGRTLSYKAIHRRAFSVGPKDFRKLTVLKHTPQLDDEDNEDEEDE